MDRIRTMIRVEARLARAIERLSAGLSIRRDNGKGVLVRAFDAPPSEDRASEAR